MPKKDAARTWRGNPQLEPFLVALGSLAPDPANARRHGEKNLRAIQGSLRRFGQQKLIVRDADGVVRAGNGTLEAARSLGWTHLAAVTTDLRDSIELAGFAIADNRSGELAEWDAQALDVQVSALADAGVDAADVGFDAGDLESLLGQQGPSSDSPDDEAVPEGSYREQFGVIVVCGDEAEQQRVYEALQAQGYNCRVVVT